jgi:hypothetical protein
MFYIAAKFMNILFNKTQLVLLEMSRKINHPALPVPVRTVYPDELKRRKRGNVAVQSLF